MADRQLVPMSSSTAPETSGHLSLLLHEMRNPVATPATVADAVGTISRRPELVADSRRTAWK
jgi:hypothetical protein